MLYKCDFMLLTHMICSIMQLLQANDLHPINRIMLTCKHEHSKPLKQTLQGKTVEQYRYTHDVRVVKTARTGKKTLWKGSEETGKVPLQCLPLQCCLWGQSSLQLAVQLLLKVMHEQLLFLQ